ncbi:MAG: Pr6Pr family membrane protein [Solobacterium sp.]|nr:Pr6Pr family membrane protein [Solobacterium sp.]
MELSTTGRKASYLLKLVVIVSALIGVLLSAMAGRTAFMGGRRVFMFFTIQSNIAIALICLAGLIMMHRRTKIPAVWYTIKFVGTVSITLTGIVYCVVLAPTLGRFAWALQNVLTHVVVPAAAIIDFFVTGVASEIPVRNVFWVIVPPLLYAVYAGIGYIAGWEFMEGIHYPYFFLNWGSPAGAFGFTDGLPYMGCAWWILLLLLFLIGVGRLYLALIGIIKRLVGRQS